MFLVILRWGNGIEPFLMMTINIAMTKRCVMFPYIPGTYIYTQVDIHPEGYFTVRRNEDGSDRYLAVKKMEWEVINRYRGFIGEVRGVMWNYRYTLQVYTPYKVASGLRWAEA